MSAIEQIVNKPIKEMTAIEHFIYEKYIQWNQKTGQNSKSGYDAIQAADELAAMQARIEKLAEYPERLQKAIIELRALISPTLSRSEQERIAGKIDGVKIALYYFEEMTR